jgi:hypothetical protein
MSLKGIRARWKLGEDACLLSDFKKRDFSSGGKTLT